MRRRHAATTTDARACPASTKAARAWRRTSGSRRGSTGRSAIAELHALAACRRRGAVLAHRAAVEVVAVDVLVAVVAASVGARSERVLGARDAALRASAGAAH